MSGGGEMARYGSTLPFDTEESEENDESPNNGVVVRKEENILALFRYIFSWFRRKGKPQAQPSACCA